MQKIDIICHRYELTQKDGYIKLDDVLNKVTRKERMKRIEKDIENNIIILDNEKYITQDKFKEICKLNKWYKTNEINYIFETNINFNIINFENNLIHIIIKDNIKYYRLFDLGKILEYKHKGTANERLNSNEKSKLKDLLDTKICTLFGTDSNTNFITKEGVIKLLLKSRKDFDIREKLAKKLDIKINLHTDKVVAIETNCITLIKTGLPDDTIIKSQYCIDGYFLDMYLPEYNLVIECDEFGHSKYNKDKDNEREKYIKNKLKCEFIRFNPDAKNFNIITVIKEIYKVILIKKNLDNLSNKEDSKKDNKKIKVKTQKIINKNHNNNIEKEPKIKVNKEIEIKIIDENISNNESIKNIKLYKPLSSQKTNKCMDCDAEIYYGNQRCTYCMNKKKFQDSCKNTDRPTREQLLKDIQELGYTGSGKKYGVSDNCVRKWIKGYDKFNL
jgi:very-short-patch-repair endonuclease